jgi:hypothetical protein
MKTLTGITLPEFELWLANAHKAVNLPAPSDVGYSVGYKTLKYLTKDQLTDALAAIVESGRKLEYGESLATVLLRAHRFLQDNSAKALPGGPCTQGCIHGAFYLLSPAGLAGVELCAHCHPKERRSMSRADVERAKVKGWRELTAFEYMKANLYGPRYLAMQQVGARP